MSLEDHALSAFLAPAAVRGDVQSLLQTADGMSPIRTGLTDFRVGHSVTNAHVHRLFAQDGEYEISV